MNKTEKKVPQKLNRRLGRTEHIYWLLDQLYCLNFLVIAELGGTLDADELQHSLDLVQLENPGLRVQITTDISGRPRFESTPASTHPLKLKICELRNWRKNLEAQLITPFDCENAPLARLLWFQGKGRKSVVAMVFHHSIADGKSGVRILLDVLSRAAGQELAPHYKKAQPSSQQLDLIRGKSIVGGKLQELKFWLNEGKNILKFPEQIPGYDSGIGKKRKIKTIPFSISSEASTALLAACRQNETTVHGALGAALLVALNKEFESGKTRYLGVNSLVDLRAGLEGGLTEQDLGIYISTVTTVHLVDKQPDFWKLAREIPTEVKKVINSGDANLVNSIYPEMPLFTYGGGAAERLQKVVGMAAPSSMLTNIGRVETRPLGDKLHIKAVSFAVSPPIQHPILMTIASYNGKLYCTVLYDQYKLDKKQATRITKNIHSRLEQEASR